MAQIDDKPTTDTTPPAPTEEVKVSTDIENNGEEERKQPTTDTTQPPATTSQQQQGDVDVDVADTSGSDRKIKTLQDVIDTLGKPETQEERRKRERREKSAKIISAVSDGLSALGNLYFTSQYAPNMYNYKGSQLEAQRASIERAKKDREEKADQYMNYALALGDAENERAKTVRELEAQQERRRLAREKAQREAEAHNWEAALQPDKRREQAGKADKAGQEARTAQAEADNAPAMQQAKLETEKARKGSYQASAANSRASAAAHGRSNVAEFSAWDEKGREHKFRTAAAAEAFARQHGTWQETDEEETTTTKSRRSPSAPEQSRTSTKRTKGGYAGRPAPEDNTPPSRRNNDDNTPPSRQR